MTGTLRTVGDARAWALPQMRRHRCDDARRNAGPECEWLLRLASGLSREQLLDARRPLTPAAARRFRALVARRLRHEPLAYVLGTAWFMDREFEVNGHVLIPRPATEFVLAAALEVGRAIGVDAAVDVGTGSGCIAVSLALELPNARIFATDLSIPAFATARRNANRHGVFSATPAPGRVTFRKANLLGFAPTPVHRSSRPIPLPATAVPLIVANLPYVPTVDRQKLSACVRHEPSLALFGGKDGLNPSRALLRQAAALPNKRMVLVFEILAKQYRALAAATAARFPDAVISKIKNPHGITVGLLVRIGFAPPR